MEGKEGVMARMGREENGKTKRNEMMEKIKKGIRRKEKRGRKEEKETNIEGRKRKGNDHDGKREKWQNEKK